MTLDSNNYLSHYGVLGMKWGIRKSRRSSGKKRSRRKEDLSDLSYQQLLDRVNRLNLEKRYYELSKPEKSAGKKFVEDVLQSSGKEVAKKYVTKGMDKSVEALLKKAKAATK